MIFKELGKDWERNATKSHGLKTWKANHGGASLRGEAAAAKIKEGA